MPVTLEQKLVIISQNFMRRKRLRAKFLDMQWDIIRYIGAGKFDEVKMSPKISVIVITWKGKQ